MQRIPIHNFLPHRKPMLMVDYIDEISPNHVQCSFVVTEDNIFLTNGFFQETGLVEHMAQTCSSIVGQTYYSEDYNPNVDERVVGFISAIKSLHIEDLPSIGAHISTLAKLVSKFDGEGYSICTMLVQSHIDNKVCAHAEINLFLKDRK